MTPSIEASATDPGVVVRGSQEFAGIGEVQVW